MRARDPYSALEDALRAGEAVAGFIDGRTERDYQSDLMLSSAVERQFEIIGEAISKALKAMPALESKIPEAHRVISFRNVLAHDYDGVASDMVWSTAHESLPPLIARLRTLIEEAG